MNFVKRFIDLELSIKNPYQDCVIDVLVKDDPPKRGTPLPGRAHASEGSGPDHHLEVGALVHDEGIVATELQDRLAESIIDLLGESE